MATLDELRTRSESSIEDVAKLEQNIPGLVSGLQKNLTSIFAKDNPLIQKREGLLTDYLSTPARTAASILPTNLPVVAGSNLNLSPTQQNAISSSREAAAFAPLASLNNLIVGQYGNIGDMVRSAADQYQAQLGAAKTRSSSLFDLYRQAYAEDQDRLDRDERSRAGAQPGLGSEIAALLAGLTGGGGGAGGGAPDITALDSLLEDDEQPDANYLDILGGAALQGGRKIFDFFQPKGVQPNAAGNYSLDRGFFS